MIDLMDARAAVAASSSSSSPKRWKHDVFLSFRGEDTRKTFTDNLYWTLKDNKVNVFIDENELRRGENITDELVEAIKRSRIAVVVFSKRYADSRWCLEELEKIVECRATMGQILLPIFYDVDPSEVRHQTGSFATAFGKHEECFDGDMVQRWRSAFTLAANLAGGNLRNTDGYEGKFIRKVVDDITRRLKSLNNTYPDVPTNQIGIDSRVQLISNELDVGGSNNVHIIGILGMVGTGKTTVAKAIFRRFHQMFEGSCFLSKVREEDMVKLQIKLLSDILKLANVEVSSVDQGTKEIKRRLGRMRVLVIIDELDCVKQLHELAINRDTFGPGSRIIIITRDKHLLKILEVDKTCTAQIMNKEEALELFCCHAFTESYPADEEYLELSSKVVNYCGGLPLALEVLGSYLCTKLKSEWRSALRKLKRHPHMPIYEKLKISYDGLIDDDVKDIFLDISCFFIGMNKEHVMAILDGCDFDPEIGIGELCDRGLVTVDEGNNLVMHDLLRDMGRQIVRAKSPNILGKRCRLWDQEDVKDVLRSKSGTEFVEGLVLDLQEPDKASFSTEAFKEMQRLRLLKLKGVKFKGNCEHLSKRLRWLCWPEFPQGVIPKDFTKYLVDVNLSHSKIQVWNDSNMRLEKLKFLNLGYCHHLKRSPNFSKLPNLEKLLLNDCQSFSEVHPSIVQLKNLKYLSLANCDLTDDALPKDLGGLSSLDVLDLSGNCFYGLPNLSGLSKLHTLQLNNCTNLRVIPDLPKKLEILEADECIALEKMPDFSDLSSMRELHLNHCPKLTEIPGLDKLSNIMTRIHMEGCTNLTAACKEIILQLPSLSLPPSPLFAHKYNNNNKNNKALSH
nr:TMV resistance protein N [Malus domestica]